MTSASSRLSRYKLVCSLLILSLSLFICLCELHPYLYALPVLFQSIWLPNSNLYMYMLARSLIIFHHLALFSLKKKKKKRRRPMLFSSLRLYTADFLFCSVNTSISFFGDGNIVIIIASKYTILISNHTSSTTFTNIETWSLDLTFCLSAKIFLATWQFAYFYIFHLHQNEKTCFVFSLRLYQKGK